MSSLKLRDRGNGIEGCGRDEAEISDTSVSPKIIHRCKRNSDTPQPRAFLAPFVLFYSSQPKE
jgi:hypothetical protein